MKDLAVIMSIYYEDRVQFVRESVESILSQTLTDFDYYIVFDGPVSGEIENYFYTLKDHRIILNRLETKKGLAVALNYLLEIVFKNPAYQFIARMDADDISLPTRFEKQHNFLLENHDISCVGSWYYEIDELGKHLSDIKLPVEHEALKRRYYSRTPFAHPSVMYNRNLIEIAGFYPTNTILMEDNVLWGKALKAGLRFANIPEYLFKFRIDNNFFKRRSGINYGWNYIKTRLGINRFLNAPLYFNFISVGLGISRMLPSFVLKVLYQLFRK
ncbi:MAG: glycosyltransferase [Bacteroidales bacterium]